MGRVNLLCLCAEGGHIKSGFPTVPLAKVKRPYESFVPLRYPSSHLLFKIVPSRWRHPLHRRPRADVRSGHERLLFYAQASDKSRLESFDKVMQGAGMRDRVPRSIPDTTIFVFQGIHKEEFAFSC